MRNALRRAVLGLMIAVVVGGIAVTVWAVGERQAFTGTVQTIDTKTATLTVQGTTVTRIFQIKSDTAIVTPDKDSASLGDLKAADRVNVAYVESNNLLIARRVEVVP